MSTIIKFYIQGYRYAIQHMLIVQVHFVCRIDMRLSTDEMQ